MPRVAACNQLFRYQIRPLICDKNEKKRMKRDEALALIKQKPEISVLIIGAGINGIGIFRDLALQGVNVLMVDKDDFCSKTSAASSRMIHGGLRYLENGEFRLVRESVRERNRLLQNAPHYVKPQLTTIPIFTWFSGLLNAPLRFIGASDEPTDRGAVVIKIGLSLYDWYTRQQKTVPKHYFCSRSKSLELHPQLNPEIVCTASYYDAQMPYAERIGIELILDAEADCPHAKAINYLSLVSAQNNVIKLQDEITKSAYEVEPKLVVNATGPWIDSANRCMGRQTHFIQGTKGAHIILENNELWMAIGNEMFFFENHDGRIVMMCALEDKVIVGSTDIHIKDPDLARCTPEEVDYLLSMVNVIFPDIFVDRAQIVFKFSGVRPLSPSQASRTGQISRDHSVKLLEPGDGLQFTIYSLVGGKWTTFNAFAEEVTDSLLSCLGKKRITNTNDLPIGGGLNFPQTDSEQRQWLSAMQTRTGIPFNRMKELLERYGTRAETIATFITEDEDKPLEYKPDLSRREVAFLSLNEKVAHLDDVLLRRTLLGMLGELSSNLIDEIATIVGEELSWSADRRRKEIKRTLDILSDYHGVKLTDA